MKETRVKALSRYDLADGLRFNPHLHTLPELMKILDLMDESWSKIEKRELLGALRFIVHHLILRLPEEGK